jgi:hypothetical protein
VFPVQVFLALTCFGPVPALGKRYLSEEKLDKPSKNYIWHKWRDTQHLNEYTMKPVDAVVVNQVIAHVAFSEVTTYYIDCVREPPTRRPVGDPEMVDVVQAHEFIKIGPFDPVDV